MNKILKQKPHKSITSNKCINALYKNISGYVRSARQNVLQAINTIVKAYWLIILNNFYVGKA